MISREFYTFHLLFLIWTRTCYNNYAILWTENSQVVDLVLLHLPYIMVPKWPAHFTVWRHTQRDIHIWGAEDSQFFPPRLLWFSTWSIGHCGCCSDCFPSCICNSFCVLHREIKFPEEIKEKKNKAGRKIAHTVSLGFVLAWSHSVQISKIFPKRIIRS